MHKLIAATATATSTTSIGTGERTENEKDCSRKALTLLIKMLSEEYKESYEIVTVEN